jgi:hypothetical protein
MSIFADNAPLYWGVGLPVIPLKPYNSPEKGAGKAPKTESEKARKKSYYARHDAQDPSPDKMSARFWSHKVKW